MKTEAKLIAQTEDGAVKLHYLGKCGELIPPQKIYILPPGSKPDLLKQVYSPDWNTIHYALEFPWTKETIPDISELGKQASNLLDELGLPTKDKPWILIPYSAGFCLALEILHSLLTKGDEETNNKYIRCTAIEPTAKTSFEKIQKDPSAAPGFILECLRQFIQNGPLNNLYTLSDQDDSQLREELTQAQTIEKQVSVVTNNLEHLAKRRLKRKYSDPRNNSQANEMAELTAACKIYLKNLLAVYKWFASDQQPIIENTKIWDKVSFIVTDEAVALNETNNDDKTRSLGWPLVSSIKEFPYFNHFNVINDNGFQILDAIDKQTEGISPRNQGDNSSHGSGSSSFPLTDSPDKSSDIEEDAVEEMDIDDSNIPFPNDVKTPVTAAIYWTFYGRTSPTPGQVHGSSIIEEASQFSYPPHRPGSRPQ